MNLKRDALLNTIGNFSYMGVLWLMSILVVRLGNFKIAGYFSLALTTSNVYISLASYTVRLFYAADVECRFKDSQYFFLRFLTTFVSAVLCLIGSSVIGYTGYQISVIVLFYVYKCLEMMSDIIYGCLQRYGKLYLGGFSLIIKSAFSLAGFWIALAVSGSLITSLIVIDLVAVVVFLIVDIRLLKKQKIYIWKLTKKDCKKAITLLWICFPLFLVGLCYNILPSIPRLAFERVYTPEQFGIYSSISTVTVLISTAVSCITVVIIPKLSELYHQRNRTQLLKIMMISIFSVIIFGVMAFFAAAVCGEWILTLLFGMEVSPYVSVFQLVIIATTFTSIIICLNNFFAAVNCQKLLLPGCMTGTCLCILLAIPLCKKYYMNGVAYNLIISQGIEIIILLIAVRSVIKQMKIDRD